MVYRGVDEALEREVALKTLTGDGGLESESRRALRGRGQGRRAPAAPEHRDRLRARRGSRRAVHRDGAAAGRRPRGGAARGPEPLSLPEKLDVMAQVCRGLAYAHERGIVHRDVKPSNVRLLDDGTAKIMDFGIAKLGGTHLTKTGMMVGTVHYMSPEQVRGKPLDGRSDVFSAGVILYEMLAGERPFRGEGATQVLYKIVNEPPPPLDLDALGALGPRLCCDRRARAREGPRGALPERCRVGRGPVAALQDELQRAADPRAGRGALGVGRRAAPRGGGRHAEAVDVLRARARRRAPTTLEARRALRARLREQSRHAARRRRPRPTAIPSSRPRSRPPPPATRRRPRPAPASCCRPWRCPRSGESPRLPAVPAESEPARAWLWAALAVVLLALGSAFVLLRARPARSGSRAARGALAAGGRARARRRPRLGRRDQRRAACCRAPAPQQVVLTFRKAGHRDETRTVLHARAGRGVRHAGGDRPTARREDRSGRRQRDASTASAWRARRRCSSLSTRRPSTGSRPRSRGTSPRSCACRAATPRPALELHAAEARAGGHGRNRLFATRSTCCGAASRSRAAPPRPRVSVPGGRQVLTLSAPAVFLRAEVSVNVPSGGETALEAPGARQAERPRQPRQLRGVRRRRFVDYPPILDRPAVVGRHTVAFRWPDGRRNEQVVELQRGAPAFVFGAKGVAVPRYALLLVLPLPDRRASAGRRRTPDDQAMRLLEDGRSTARRASSSRRSTTSTIVVGSFRRHRGGRSRAARDRALPAGGRRRRGQGARRVRPGDQGARAQRRCARRLLLPRACSP